MGLSCDDSDRSIRVMSFNIRYSAGQDGEHCWPNRAHSTLAAIRTFDPHLLGTQEVLLDQREFLVSQLDDYFAVGVGRDDGKTKGEMALVFCRRNRFDLIDSGTFWLSSTPDQIGSIGWDAHLPRIATWVKLCDKRDSQAAPILFINAHLDHAGETSRVESCALIKKKSAELADGSRVIVAGDFNSTEDESAYRALVDRALIDTYRYLHANRSADERTFHGFDQANTRGSRIDWIICDQTWLPIDAGIDHKMYHGRLPSDHFPVWAVLRPMA